MSPRAQQPGSPSRMQSEKAESIPETAAETAAATHQSVGTGSAFLHAVAHLGRAAVHVSARASDEFWPPPSVSTPHGAHAHGPTQVSAMDASQHLEGMVDQERPLISIIAEGGLLKYQQVPFYHIPCTVAANTCDDSYIHISVKEHSETATCECIVPAFCVTD